MPTLTRSLVPWPLALPLLLVLGCSQDSMAANGQPIHQGQLLGHDFQVISVIKGLRSPWGLDFISQNQLVITEKAGQVQLLDLASLELQAIAGAPEVSSRGQGGLLDVARGPAAESDWLYFTYSKPKSGQAATALGRAQIEGQRLINWQDLLVTDSWGQAQQHFGARIAFDDQGHLYFGVGDRGDRDSSQDLSSANGGIIRLHLDGSIPKDNPWQDQTGLNYLYSYGHRNPQGIAFDFQTQRLWANEHGPRGGDELNLIEAGQNYGWPEVSLGREYWGPIAIGKSTSPEGMQDPVLDWTPSIAPSSLTIYSGPAFEQWQGLMLSTALAGQHLAVTQVNEQLQVTEQWQLLAELGERLRAARVDQQGLIYLLTDSGQLLRIEPVPDNER